MKISDVYPIDTVVRLKKTGQFAIIKSLNLLNKSQYGFLNYLGEIEGRRGQYALYHDDIELEALPGPTALGKSEIR